MGSELIQMDIARDEFINTLKRLRSKRAVAVHYGRSPSWVTKQCARFGIPYEGPRQFDRPARDVFVAELARLGSAAAVAAHHGKPPDWAHRLARRWQIDLVRRDNSIHDDRIHDLYFDKVKSLAEVAGEIGLPVSSVQERFRVNGWNMRDRTSAARLVRRFDHEECCRLYRQGSSSIYLGHLYGVTPMQIITVVKQAGIRPRHPSQNGAQSGYERIVADHLDRNGIPYTAQALVSNSNSKRAWSFDFLIPDNLLIEIQGEFFHNRADVARKDRRKRVDAQGQGYRVVWLPARACVDEVLLATQIEFARQIPPLDILVVERVDYSEVASLVERIHYLGSAPMQIKVCYGCRWNGKVIGAAVFSEPLDRAHRGRLELSRLVTLDGGPANLTSWFLSRSLRGLNSPVVSYCDGGAGHDGAIYRATNFVKAGETRPSYAYMDRHQRRIHKRTVYARAIRAQMAESDYAALKGLVRVPLPPKSIYLFPPQSSPMSCSSKAAAVAAT